MVFAVEFMGHAFDPGRIEARMKHEAVKQILDQSPQQNARRDRPEISDIVPARIELASNVDQGGPQERIGPERNEHLKAPGHSIHYSARTLH